MSNEHDFTRYARGLDPIQQDNRLNSGSSVTRVAQLCVAVAVFAVLGSFLSAEIRQMTMSLTGVDVVMMGDTVSTHLEQSGTIYVDGSQGAGGARDSFGSWTQAYNDEPSFEKMTFFDKLFAGYK